MIKICLLASGELGYECLIHLKKISKIKAVFTDFNSKKIQEDCEDLNIPLFNGNPRNRRASLFIKELTVEYIISVNYLYLIEADLLQLPTMYAINIHGSLLPKYRGRTPHVWSIINGEPETGVTAHIMDLEVDNGDILIQETVEICSDDSGDDILVKYKPLYKSILNKLIEGITSNSITPTVQDNEKASLFPKRTPDDGRINWDWYNIRLHNWIRALRKPYPGAFTFYEDSKVIINRSEDSTLGFSFDEHNGTILKIEKDALHIKVCNKVIRAYDIECADNIIFEPGKRLT